MRYGGRSGFTLVELLVVIAIIAVVAGMLFPVYLNAKTSAQRARCQSNLSQIAKAFEMYISDYGGCYPNIDNQYLWAGYYWRDPLRKYVVAPLSATPKMILACPADPTPPGIYAGTSYAYSACFYMTPDQVNAVADNNHIRSKFAATNPKLPCYTMKTSDVRYATRKALVAEYWTLHSTKPKVGWYDDPAEAGNDPWSGARNYLLADGHTVCLSTKRIHRADSPVVARPRLLPDINLTRDGVAGKDID
jgi:prepilin-type N-terminal cleavage/methylation domain-containing protein